ncbi:hypothetical protein D3C86_1940080 [compost metagenome]
MHAISGKGQGPQQFYIAGIQLAVHIARHRQQDDDGQRPAALGGVGPEPGMAGKEQVDERAGCAAQGQFIGDLSLADILFGT